MPTIYLSRAWIARLPPISVPLLARRSWIDFQYLYCPPSPPTYPSAQRAGKKEQTPCAPVGVQGGNSGLAWHAFGAAHLHVVCSTSLFPLHIRVAVQILVHSRRRRRRRLGTHVRQPQRRIARPRLSFTIPPPSSEHKSIMPPQYA